MKKETLLEVVSELIGYTEPYGDSNVDEVRYKNQEKIIELVVNGVEALINNAAYKDRPEYSMAQIGGRAYEILEELHKVIEDNL
mgnify:CR=1 FL=1